MNRPLQFSTFVLQENDLIIVRPVFAFSLFTDVPFSKLAQSVLECYETFLKLCPRGQIKHYLTESMDKHKPTTNRTFAMLPSWLRKGAAKREQIYLELMDRANPEEAPEFRLVVSGHEKGSIGFEGRSANTIHMSFPAQWGIDRTDTLIELVETMAATMPFSSGHAGFSLSWSPYFDQEAGSFLFAKGMRHPGFDIFDNSNDEDVAGHDSIKTVSWLNLFGPRILAELGGESRLRKLCSGHIRMHAVGAGRLVIIGESPRIGDITHGDDLPDYRRLYRFVAPIAERGIRRTFGMEFHPGDVHENTLLWFRRFSPS